tara:strand:+ start:263 stop:571 length:309 start_codon:yes stop_codon:yes gene_type:complete
MNIKITTSYKPIREEIVQHVHSAITIATHWSTHSTGEHFITDILVYIPDALPDFKAIEKAIADWDWETRGFEFDFNSDTIEIERFVDPDRGRSESTVQWENT